MVFHFHPHHSLREDCLTILLHFKRKVLVRKMLIFYICTRMPIVLAPNKLDLPKRYSQKVIIEHNICTKRNKTTSLT